MAVWYPSPWWKRHEADRVALAETPHQAAIDQKDPKGKRKRLSKEDSE